MTGFSIIQFLIITDISVIVLSIFLHYGGWQEWTSHREVCSCLKCRKWRLVRDAKKAAEQMLDKS